MFIKNGQHNNCRGSSVGGSHGEGQRRNIRKRQGWAYNNIYIRDDTVRGLFSSTFPPSQSPPLQAAGDGGGGGGRSTVHRRHLRRGKAADFLEFWWDFVDHDLRLVFLFHDLMSYSWFMQFLWFFAVSWEKLWFLRFVCLILVFSAPIGRQSSWNLFKSWWRRHLLSLL